MAMGGNEIPKLVVMSGPLLGTSKGLFNGLRSSVFKNVMVSFCFV